jgi:hypothetical protein
MPETVASPCEARCDELTHWPLDLFRQSADQLGNREIGILQLSVRPEEALQAESGQTGPLGKNSTLSMAGL